MVTYGGRGVSNVVKVPEFDKIPDFGPHLGGRSLRPVDPLKIVQHFKFISVQRPFI